VKKVPKTYPEKLPTCRFFSFFTDLNAAIFGHPVALILMWLRRKSDVSVLALTART
jgi:hypothetical protein